MMEVGSTSEDEILLVRSEIVNVVTHKIGYGNTIVDGREKDQWLKSVIDRYYQGFSEHRFIREINVRNLASNLAEN